MKIGIYGYGNIGRGVEAAFGNNPDASLFAIFTRRPPERVKSLTGAPVLSAASVTDFKREIDVLIICGGSAADLPALTPMLAREFNVVDSFDNHSKISEHFKRVDKSACEGGKIALISSGWDPGLFSLARLYASAALPDGKSYTFWGRGISQGHSDAIRRVEGVLDARQYTVPLDEYLSLVREGKNPLLTPCNTHRRECYVVAKEGYDKEKIEREIKEMPSYFKGYDTTVKFVTEDELLKSHSGMPHGGSVIRCGRTGLFRESLHTVEFSLTLKSNPEFTGGMLLASARAAYKMAERGDVGCKTLFDIPPGYFLRECDEKMRAELL